MNDLLQHIDAGDAHAVRALLARDPDLARGRDDDGASLLMHAVYRGDPAVIEAIRAFTPTLDVFEAAALGETDALAGDPNAHSPDGFTPLHLAAFRGHAAAVRALLERGADPEAMSRHRFVKVRPLHTACALDVSVENPDVVRALLEHGADPDGRTAEGGATPLHSAAQSGSAELVRLLLEHGADRHARRDDGQTPADVAADAEIRALLG